MGGSSEPLLQRRCRTAAPSDPASPARPSSADVIVVESTYGNRVHEPAAGALERMVDAIVQTARHGSTVVIPSFAVDRTEVLIMALGELVQAGKVPRLPIYAELIRPVRYR